MKVLKLDVDIHLFPLGDLKPGWKVNYHEFYQVYPDKKVLVEECPGYDYWELFKSTLLVLENEKENIAIDIGWQPEAAPEGRFCIRLVSDFDYSEPIKEVFTRIPDEALAIAMDWLK